MILTKMISVSRRSREAPSLTHSWSRASASRKLSHTLVLSSSLSNSIILKLSALTWSLKSRLRKTVQRLDLQTQKISKELSMLSGKSFTISLTRLLPPEPRSSSLNSPSVIWRLSTSQTETFSAQAVSQKMTLSVRARQLELFCRQQLMVCKTACWEHAESLKKSSSETSATICSLSATTPRL